MSKWRPQVNRKPVPGRKSRILLYDPVTEEVIGEEKPSGKKDPTPAF